MTSGGVCSTYFSCFVETSLSSEGYSIETEDIYVSNLPLGKLQSVCCLNMSQMGKLLYTSHYLNTT